MDNTSNSAEKMKNTNGNDSAAKKKMKSREKKSPRYVDHTYRNYSRYVEEGGELITHKKSTDNFPARLHKALSIPDHSDVITWQVSAAVESTQ